MVRDEYKVGIFARVVGSQHNSEGAFISQMMSSYYNQAVYTRLQEHNANNLVRKRRSDIQLENHTAIVIEVFNKVYCESDWLRAFSKHVLTRVINKMNLSKNARRFWSFVNHKKATTKMKMKAYQVYDSLIGKLDLNSFARFGNVHDTVASYAETIAEMHDKYANKAAEYADKAFMKSTAYQKLT